MAPVTAKRANAVLDSVIDVPVALIPSPSSTTSSVPVRLAMMRVACTNLHAYLATIMYAIVL